jgi:hypothetical protein
MKLSEHESIRAVSEQDDRSVLGTHNPHRDFEGCRMARHGVPTASCRNVVRTFECDVYLTNGRRFGSVLPSVDNVSTEIVIEALAPLAAAVVVVLYEEHFDNRNWTFAGYPYRPDQQRVPVPVNDPDPVRERVSDEAVYRWVSNVRRRQSVADLIFGLPRCFSRLPNQHNNRKASRGCCYPPAECANPFTKTVEARRRAPFGAQQRKIREQQRQKPAAGTCCNRHDDVAWMSSVPHASNASTGTNYLARAA